MTQLGFRDGFFFDFGHPKIPLLVIIFPTIENAILGFPPFSGYIYIYIIYIYICIYIIYIYYICIYNICILYISLNISTLVD